MKHELLAPAGNIEAGYAALHYGADAVYLGLTKFSARAGAENFTADELDEFTAYAHSLNRKVFVALNTVLTEAEIDELSETFAAIRKARVDALIIQDLGVFYLAKRMLPEVELHASTQMAVHNAEGAKFLQSVGFKRVVLARELSVAEIKSIAAACPGLDLEVFVHGALCYSYSGQCLFSALEYGKSANRGRCVYPCRSLFEKREICPTDSQMEASRQSGYVRLCTLPSLGGHLRSFEQISHFSSTSEDEIRTNGLPRFARNDEGGSERGENIRSHLFSMKDLALEEAVLSIPALSLKIEGRKKSPLYVAAVTNYYRHILDGRKKDLNEAEDIKQIFSRPWCRFHFNGKDKTVTDENFVGHRGLLIGKVERVGKGRLGFKTSHTVARYDGVQVDSGNDEKPFGFGVKALFVNGKPTYEAKAGQYVELELPEERPHLAVGAPVYLASSTAVKGKYDYLKPKPGAFRNLTALEVVVEIAADVVWAFGSCVAGDPLMAVSQPRDDKNLMAVSVSGCFEPAKDVAKVEEAVRTAFAKTGGTAFEVRSLEVRNPEGRFVPVSMLNELRRQLLEQICARGTCNDGVVVHSQRCGCDARNDGVEREREPAGLEIVDVALDMDVLALDVDMKDVWFRLPQICRNMAKLSAVVAKLYERGAKQFIAENYYAFELLKPYKDVRIGAGSFLYVMNSYAVLALAEFGVAFATLALESSPENMRAVVAHSAIPLAQVIKAYPPLFTSAVCIRPNACKDCKRGVKRYQLKKDGKEYIAVSKDCQIQLFAAKAYEREAVDGVAYVVEE
ncbi:MAG: U32 family peptidase [Acetobacter sp.]|nr:U32 family peptidase [Acetobacter sp.]